MRGPWRAIPILLWGGIFTVSSCSSPEGGTAGHSRRVNLTTKAWFPPVVPQQASSCAQHAGLYYLLACEINRARGGPPAILPGGSRPTSRTDSSQTTARAAPMSWMGGSSAGKPEFPRNWTCPHSLRG